MQAGLQRLDKLGLVHPELVQHILGLRVDMSGAAGDVFLAGEGALQIGIADGRADRVGVRIFMSNDDDRFHMSISLLLS
jgi:hypothetical protein